MQCHCQDTHSLTKRARYEKQAPLLPSSDLLVSPSGPSQVKLKDVFNVFNVFNKTILLG